MTTETKTCRYCGEDKPITAFHVALTTPQKIYRRRKCRDCYHLAKQKLRERKRQHFRDFKRQLKCERCGNDDHRVLQFHHDNADKEANIADVVAYWSHERLNKEIQKCSILCANCHIILHWEQQQGVAQSGQSARLGTERPAGSNPATLTILETTTNHGTESKYHLIIDLRQASCA